MQWVTDRGGALTALEQLAVVLAGFGAGILTSSVGIASLLSFPVLLAVGIPPVVANVSNTLGLILGGVGGVVGYREELREEPALTRRIVILTGIAGAVGAALLLALPIAKAPAAPAGQRPAQTPPAVEPVRRPDVVVLDAGEVLTPVRRNGAMAGVSGGTRE